MSQTQRCRRHGARARQAARATQRAAARRRETQRTGPARAAIARWETTRAERAGRTGGRRERGGGTSESRLHFSRRNALHNVCRKDLDPSRVATQAGGHWRCRIRSARRSPLLPPAIRSGAVLASHFFLLSALENALARFHASLRKKRTAHFRSSPRSPCASSFGRSVSLPVSRPPFGPLPRRRAFRRASALQAGRSRRGPPVAVLCFCRFDRRPSGVPIGASNDPVSPARGAAQPSSSRSR